MAKTGVHVLSIGVLCGSSWRCHKVSLARWSDFRVSCDVLRSDAPRVFQLLKHHTCTECPGCRSGRLGSLPSLTRRGLPLCAALCRLVTRASAGVAPLRTPWLTMMMLIRAFLPETCALAPCRFPPCPACPCCKLCGPRNALWYTRIEHCERALADRQPAIVSKAFPNAWRRPLRRTPPNQ